MARGSPVLATPRSGPAISCPRDMLSCSVIRIQSLSEPGVELYFAILG
jgi:hypothetical protein